MKASGNKHDGRAAKTAPAAAVDVLGAAGERGVREADPPLADPGPGVDEVILNKTFLNLIEF